MKPTRKKKEVKKQVREATDMQLIFWIQDINRPGGEEKYTKEFQKAVQDEICRRGS